MRCDELPYIIDLDAIARASTGRKRVVLQLPDGMKRYGADIVECLRGVLGDEVEFYVHADSIFGACDLQYGELEATIHPDLIVHIGHSPYPMELAHERHGGPQILYVPALSRLEPKSEMIEEAVALLRERGVKEVAVVTNAQHVHVVGNIRSMLKAAGMVALVPRGVSPYFADGQIIGCDYRLARSIKADGFLYFGGGIFHPLGVYLATFKPVIKVDPYENRVVDLTREGEKIYKRRLYEIVRAFDAERWAIVVGTKSGQYRPWLVRSLIAEMKAADKKYLLLSSGNTTLQNIIAVDNEWIEAFTITNCPRIPTDDEWSYGKPVLTPGETIMALRRQLEPYRFPW